MTKFDSAYGKLMFDRNATDYIGTDVIVLSNEPDPVIRGVLVGWTEISQSGQKAPIVRYTPSPTTDQLNPEMKDVVVFGHILPYTDELWGLIGDWSSAEAFHMFGAIRNMYDKMRRMSTPV